ncbi:MAG: efflux RND transporter permease subunit, partial [Gemmatimonadales bacterium]
PYTAATLAELAREDIVPALSSIEGIAGINTSGGAERGISVTYDPQLLRQVGIPPAQLGQAIGNARVVRSLGQQQAGASVRPVVLRDQPGIVADLLELPVTGPGGRVFRLGDLARVRMEEDSRDVFFRVNGEPAVSIEISRLPGADAIKTAARVRAAMDVVTEQLPPGIGIRLESDESVELRNQLNDLLLRGGIAFLAVLVVLAIALRNAKSVLLVMGSAAVAIAGTALGLYLLNIPANLLTLAGLGMGVGILVQNALVVVDRLRTTEDTPEGRASASARITPAVIGATLTTAVVLLPFLYLQGNARAEFVPFAVAFALALAWSVASALIMIPALGAGHGLRQGHWPRMSRIYGKSLVLLLRGRYVALVIVVAGLGYVGWAFATKVPRSSFGNWWGQRTTLSAWLSFPRGSDPASLDVAMREFEALVVGQPGVEQVVTRGSPDGAQMRVVFTREEEFGPIPYEMQEALTQRAILIGGASISVRGQGPGFYSGGGGGGASFRIKILGYSFGGVERMAFDIKRRLEQISRVRDVNA